ncbi:dephospho-CoA kinase [Salinimonas chungwhensis]|uniref:dephospho-CoA kinase n=1 Tax=Salinimonas chungwhensis TaxID=265425 RepID=UPI00036131CD|nr:dephospho-CoA kinase [Salinimonas chungwhensis]
MTKNASTFVVGLTGGIGSGKTAVSDIFAQSGVPVVDADVVARKVVMPGAPALQAITEHFGTQVLLEDGSLNRSALREQVFADATEKQWLDKLLHPAIREQMLADIDAVTAPYCILSVPLLVENNLTAMAHRVLVVDCSETLQLSRASARDNSDEVLIKKIMATQADRDTRLAAADDVIDNSGTLEQLHRQVAALHTRYLALAEGD